MSNTDDALVRRTTYSPLAILSWGAVLLGMLAVALQIWHPSAVGITFSTMGLIIGGVNVFLAGPIKRAVHRNAE